jgi:hypothetical protein
VDGCDFDDVRNRNQKARDKGVEYRRAILLCLGQRGLRDGTIHPVISYDEITRETGIPKSKVHKHLLAESRLKRFIKLKHPGQKGDPKKRGRLAAQYKLLVDKARGNPRGDSRGDPRGNVRGNPRGLVPASVV